MRTALNKFTALAFLLFYLNHFAQNEYKDPKFQFISYSKVPTWSGVATNWNGTTPEIHLYDCYTFIGHSEYVSRGLKTGLTFKQFKEAVRDYENRRYLPFFLYDLRTCPVKKDSREYTWALKIEDYSYTDSDAQMVATVSKLMKLIGAYIELNSGAKSNGLVILSKNPKSKPGTSISTPLKAAGYSTITSTLLIELTGSTKMTVMNPGIAYGYINYIPAGMENKIYPSPKDIVIYENLPARVPPVSGIITLEPQTPLSHINLLAKNRNTVNVYYTSIIHGLKLKQQKGNLVKFECKGNELNITPAKPEDAKAFWAQRIITVTIPEPNTNTANIISLEKCDSSLCNTSVIGAKASNYLKIQRAFPEYVRPGYAIPFARYLQTIKRCGADTMITSFLKNKNKLSPEKRKEKLNAIQNQIRHLPLDPLFLQEVKNLADTKFPNSRIRLRSSTNCEDLPEFNGAGLYVSKGYTSKDSLKILEQKILEVYASLWTTEAFDEREYYQINHLKVAMGILINEAFTDEYANGVLITIPTKSGLSVKINTQPADHLVTNPENGMMPESIVFANAETSEFKTESKSSIKDIFLQKDLMPYAIELKNITLQIHTLLLSENKNLDRSKSYGVDIEFRIMKENNNYKLYIKQARLLGSTTPE